MSKRFRIKETGVELVETVFGNFKSPNGQILLDIDIEALGLTLEPIKEKVTKEIVGWVNVYEGRIGSTFYKAESDALNRQGIPPNFTVQVRGTYEVEE